MGATLLSTSTIGIVSAGTTITKAITVEADCTAIIVHIGYYQGAGLGDIITSVTFGGVALTKIGMKFHDTNYGSYLWMLLNPAPGTANVVMTASGNVYAGLYVTNWKGVTGSKTAVGANANATSLSLSVDDSTAEDAVVVALVHSTPASDNITNNTELADGQIGATNVCVFAAGGVGGGAMPMVMSGAGSVIRAAVGITVISGSGGQDPTIIM